jgi:uncharacterized protein YaeQ
MGDYLDALRVGDTVASQLHNYSLTAARMVVRLLAYIGYAL